MTLKPETWGPPFWNTIHFVALGYPESPSEEDKKNMHIFLDSIKHILPCLGCRKGYDSLMKKTYEKNSVLKNRDSLFQWTVLIHSLVNIKKGETPKYNPEHWKQHYLQYKK